MARRRLNLPMKTAGQLINDSGDALRIVEGRRGILRENLGKNLGETFPDGTPVPYDEMIDFFTGSIVEPREGLIIKDRNHRDVEGDLENLRIDREKYLKLASTAVLGTRNAYEGLFGPGMAFHAGFTRILPENTREMIEHGRHLSSRLQNPTPEMLSLVADSAAEVSAFSERLDPAMDNLSMADERFRLGQDRLETATVQRTDAMEAFRDVFIPSARAIESLFRLSGLEELAKRVRRTTRTPSAGSEPPAEPDAPSPVPEAEAAAAGNSQEESESESSQASSGGVSLPPEDPGAPAAEVGGAVVADTTEPVS